MTATRIVEVLLDEQPNAALNEASVYLPPRSHVYVAAFTGPTPGERCYRTTGSTDRAEALQIARRFELEAKQKRAAYGHHFKKPTLRARQGEGLTQREVAKLLGISTRAVYEIERRILQKLRNHPDLKRLWKQHLTGDLGEHDQSRKPMQVESCLSVGTKPFEIQLIREILCGVNRPR